MRNATVRLAIGALFILAGLVGVPATQAKAQSVSFGVRELRTLQGHSFGVNSVAFSPDGRTIASGGEDSSIKLWDAASGRELQTLPGHAGSVHSVAFSPDGRTIASGSLDNSTKIWDAASGRELRTLQGHSNMSVTIWYAVWSVAFSPDGRTIALGSDDKTMRLWDAASGRVLRTLKGKGPSDRMLSVAFSPDGRTIVSGRLENTIKVWDVGGVREQRTLEGHSGGVYSVAFSPDGRTFASGSGDHSIRLWDAASGRGLQTLFGHAGSVRSVAFSPDGRTIVSGNEDNSIKLWDAASGQELQTLKGHSGIVYSVAFSPDGRTIASGSKDATIKLWDVSGFVAAPMTSSIEKVLPVVAGTAAPANTAKPAEIVVPAPTTTSIQKAEKVPPVVAGTAVPVNSATPSKIVAAAPDRRVALVIGNSAYRKVQHLPNPSRDADLIGAALRSTGIEDVTVAHNLDREGMVAALKVFARKADAADWAVIYYAGHGIEIGGTNYLIPVDAKLETERDVPEEAISLEQVQGKIQGAHKLKLIVLDACRNSPFASQMKMSVATRSVDRGFTRFEPTGATLVVYAAKERTTAKDGDGKNSPFATSFARRVIEQGIEINKALRFVRQDVLATTGNQQEPFVYGSLPPEDFYFVRPK